MQVNSERLSWAGWWHLCDKWRGGDGKYRNSELR